MGIRTIAILAALALVGALWWVASGETRVATEESLERAAPLQTSRTPDRPVDLIEPAPTVATGDGRSSASAEPLPVETEPEAREVNEAETSRPATATLFQHATHDAVFPGLSWIVGVGLTDAGRAFQDDEASAVDVPEGYALVLYTDPGGGGQRTTIAAGLHNLAPYGFNDCVSSARLVRADGTSVGVHVGSSQHVLLYEHALDSGPEPGLVWTLRLPADRGSRLFTAVARDIEDNSASALLVPPHHEVTLFDEPDGRGRALVLGPGSYDLEVMGFNDRASSVRVRRMEDDE